MGTDGTSRTADQQALIALRAMRARLDELERAVREPIAIVGMGCRLPGTAGSLAGYWDALAQSHDLVSEIPGERMEVAAIFDPQPQTPGKSCTMRAALLDRYSEFDAEFFGISPREAVTTDPQQRLLLEVSWEALEHAGIDPQSLGGSDTGVFIGISGSEYSQVLQRGSTREELKAHMLQGSALNASAGRLSYFYGLNGPSMAIDTACSSSLVAVDRACRSLRDGEIGLALAGGVNFLALRESLIIASQWGMLSSGGLVRAFDGKADGFVRGEGCGVVVLKRLSEAERAGDRVLAVVLGSAVNQDGASSGLTVPNGLAQQALLREAHRRAGVEPWQVRYVEAHGTGTALGDPIEAEALGAVFGADSATSAGTGSGSKRAAKLLLGSVKTNIGHLESAAGIAGLIKVVLALEQGMVPPQLHFERPSEHLQWEDLPLEIVTTLRAWEPIAGRRIAGVSSFGFSGTNAHVVVEGWPRAAAVKEPQASAVEELAREEVLVLAARTSWSLRELAGRYAARLLESEAPWRAVCATAAMGRAVFAERLAVVAASREEAAAKLRAWLEAEAGAAGVHRGQVSAGRRSRGVALTAAASCEEVAAAFVQGERIDWAARFAGYQAARADLPTYAFERERYWIETGARHEEDRSGEATGQGMLGRRLRSAGVRGHFETMLEASSWVGEHRVEGRVVLPATGHVELMLEAAEEAGATVRGGTLEGLTLEDVVLEAPLLVEGRRRVQVVVEEESSGRSRVRIYAEMASGAERADGAGAAKWQRVSEGWVVGRAAGKVPDALDVAALQWRLPAAVAGEPFYAGLAERGVEFGERFRGLSRGWSSENESLGEITRDAARGQGWRLEPWWLDACLQAAALAGAQAGTKELYLPLSFERLEIYARDEARTAAAEVTWSHVLLQSLDPETLSAHITVANQNGHAIAQITNLRFRRLNKARAENPLGYITSCYITSWVKWTGKLISGSLSGHWLVVAGADAFDGEMQEELLRQRVAVTVLSTAAWGEGDAATDLERTRSALRSFALSGTVFEGVIDLRPMTARSLQESEATGAAIDVSSVRSSASLLQAMVLEQIQTKRGSWFVTRGAPGQDSFAEGPAAHAIRALLRTVALEFPETVPHYASVENGSSAAMLCRMIASVDGPECRLCGGQVMVPTLEAVPARETSIDPAKNAVLDAPDSGLIEDLRYREAERAVPGPLEVEIEMEAAGLNFRDLMQSLRMLPATSESLGGECAGRVVRAGAGTEFNGGDRVFAFAPAGLSRFVRARGTYTRSVPEPLTFLQAAALPVAYLTAIYGLHRLAGLQAGETVLIHSAAGGLGLAAVHAAKQAGATIYATAGTEDRRAYLRSLGIEHVFSSRDSRFADEVRVRTEGRGVDVALNALTGELAVATLGAMARGGRFLEVGKRDTMSAAAAAAQRPDVQYLVYDLGQAAEADPTLVPELLNHLISSLERGELMPLPVTGFDRAREAFHCLARARQIGKVVVTRQAAGSARFAGIRPDASYLVTGGFGGLGMIFAEWLASRGARELVLVGRNAPGPRAMQTIRDMEVQGVVVHQMLADVGDRESVDVLCRATLGRRPVRGVLHAAGVLDNCGLLQLTPSSISRVMQAKVEGGWNLHRSTRGLDLDFFVLCSSAATLLGSPGQANYVAANGVLDALAVYRRSLGLPALSVQWGPWNAAGMTESLQVDPVRSGVRKMKPAEALACLEQLLRGDKPVAAVFAGTPQGVAAGRSAHATERIAVPPATARHGTVTSLLDRPPSEVKGAVAAFLQEKVFRTLDVKAHNDLDPHEPFQALGLDSLMAVELRNALVAELGVALPATLLLDYPTLASLTGAVMTALLPTGLTENSELTENSDAPVDLDVLGLSEAEAEALLIAELERQP